MKARNIDSEWHVHVAGPGQVDVEMKCGVAKVAFTVEAHDAAALGRLLCSVARRATRTDGEKANAIAARLLKRGRRG